MVGCDNFYGVFFIFSYIVICFIKKELCCDVVGFSVFFLKGLRVGGIWEIMLGKRDCFVFFVFKI